ncbi:citrate lyase acyl carrier protein [Pelosinus sp. IPA-1]|uniref:citrate lyase acyl carrier protein n=1 Tax=Pelosinus sp. IPA-1 TaxID=3029569 RepID=UPI0024362AE8|nr:citrate lyase acyl carrier protein [Pelosinus sp. IPA-1]GMA97324.1 citrate lyase acyl carrier protein [Pelosinus sp. IPA-1]
MLKIIQSSQAGTVESNDILIILNPAEADSGIKIDLTSPVLQKYGRQIKNVIQEVLNGQGIVDAEVSANDRGALDCTVRARMMTAIDRALLKEEAKG